ncbi:PRC-barrel domain-containing protein [Ornithinimicrobium avium]|uniref:PRC-barrel domain containing protein n=1 Tax=Ornithinimicrobium avium TaxID=2283195 RepID=A0A345NQ15_9MICO|nr:PRC-barrel domain-containing protein [Ornithinimicrobium avium]AXH97123.1 PRC-barrel domain containing protein [Ornithinimicrobium avium]
MRITQEQVQDLEAAEVVDRDGDVLGGVEQVYLDDRSGDPAWVTVRTGLFGTKETFVPLQDASLDNGQLRVPYEKGYVKDAPNFDADEHLSEQEQDRLYEYYRLDTSGMDVSGGPRTGDRDVDRDGRLYGAWPAPAPVPGMMTRG